MKPEDREAEVKKRSNSGPALFSGFDVDPMWGQDSTEEEDAELESQKKKHGEYEDLLADLGGDGGTMFRLVVKELSERANYLMSQDAQCLAMMKILNAVKAKINFGESLARSIFKKTVAP